MANTKITELTAVASLAAEDVLPVVDDPSGTPSTKKATLQQVADLMGSQPLDVEANATATSYTLVAADAYKYLRFTDAGALTLTVPTNASVGYDVGTVIEVYAAGAGGVTVQGDSGVTVNGAGSLSQYGAATLVKVATDEWDATGALA